MVNLASGKTEYFLLNGYVVLKQTTYKQTKPVLCRLRGFYGVGRKLAKALKLHLTYCL